MSAAAKLFMLILVVVATFLGYDYYLFKEGPKKWWRFWVKETPAVPAAPAAATPALASTAGPNGAVAGAKTASAAASSPTTSSTMGGSISTTAKTA